MLNEGTEASLGVWGFAEWVGVGRWSAELRGGWSFLAEDQLSFREGRAFHCP